MATMVRCKINAFGIYHCEPITIEQDSEDLKANKEHTQLIPIPRLFSWCRLFTRWYVIYSYSFPSVNIDYSKQ